MQTPVRSPILVSAGSTALLGLLVNVVLALVKLVAGIIGHSGALVADAVESLADIVGSVVIWGGLRIGALPADDDHPYGHGKAESIAGLCVVALLLGAGILIGLRAVHDIRTPHQAPEAWTLAVLVLVIVAKYGMYVFSKRVAKRDGSGAMHVDAAHHVSDAITSLAAGVGIAIAVFGPRVFASAPAPAFGSGWETADDWGALVAAGVILYNALVLLRVPLSELMDSTTSEDITRAADPARRVAMQIKGVEGIEKILARKSGGRYWLEMHVQVDPAMAVAEAHAIGGRVRAAVRESVASVRDVHVHIEPFER